MNLTVAFITSRHHSKQDWFVDSLLRHVPGDCALDVLIVDGYEATGKPLAFLPTKESHPNIRIRITEPKPTIWKGPHRITKEDWWSKSSDMNCAICLCETPFIALVDDRCILSPAWIHSVEEAIQGGYAVCGNYEKRANMRVENGEIIDPGTLLGKDNRAQAEYPYPTLDWYGGSSALPLEWCLAVNGFNEDYCDGLGSEDSVFGITLRNRGYPMRYDPRMLIIEDRTPGELDGGLRRSDFGQSPNDASHKIIELMRDKSTSQNSFDIRDMRARILAGEPWPAPTASHLHFFTSQPIRKIV